MTPEKAAVAGGALIGQSIDERYRLEGVIGVGGLGSVYRATHTKLQRGVAVKMLHETFGESQVQRGRFAREAKALAGLQHPNIVAVLDYGVADARPYLVMELLEGETLSQRLQRGALPVESALQLVQQLLEALSFMHRAQLVHRDVKPSNVFLQRMRDGHERVKVLDLGLAKFTTSPLLSSADPTLTRDGAILGTPAYMSPEQATGEAVDARSDVYAVGVILFRMLSGRLPFEGDAIDQVRSHLISPVPALDRAEPDHELDPALEALIRHAMAKRREDRFTDAGQMLRALIASFPQYVRAALPEHEPVLPDPFAVDAINAEWLLSEPDDSSDASTLPWMQRLPRAPMEALRGGARRVGHAVKMLVVASVRLFAGVSVLLVIAAGAIFVFLLRDDADRAELSALQRRVSDRLIERSMRGSASSAAETSISASTPAAEAARGQLQPGAPVAPVAPPAAPVPPPAVVLPAAEPAATSDVVAQSPVPALVEVPEQDPAAAPNARAETEADPPKDTAVVSWAPSTALVATAAELDAAFPKPGPELGDTTAGIELVGRGVHTLGTQAAPVEPALAPPQPEPSVASARTAGSGPAAPPPSAASVEALASVVTGSVPARDPWQDPVPARLRAARKAALNGGRGSEPMFMAVREYNTGRARDPRGHLILGQLYLKRFWRADALSQFTIAMQLDPSARGAPEVLDGLIALLVHGAFASEAERVISSRFGHEALPAIERALTKHDDAKIVARLRRLQARLTTEP